MKNILTALSKLDELFVISRTTSSTYKGKDVTVKQVAEDLGVRYVLEGSVQRTPCASPPSLLMRLRASICGPTAMTEM